MAWSTDFFEQAHNDADADDLADAIIKQYEKLGDHINITDTQVLENRYIYKVKFKKNTREARIRANANEVQLRLKLPLFYVVIHNFNLYIIASRKEMKYDHLTGIIENPLYLKAQEQFRLPHVIGYDVFGNIVMDDLSQYIHLLLGGSTRSGKSVGLQALITSIIYSRSPSQVNLILIDVGGIALLPFEGLPHLSCPVVQKRIDAIRTLVALNDELERRVYLKKTDRTSYNLLPRLVLVIDEFPALFNGIEKDDLKTLQETISTFLNRGSQAKIHVVLAAQNPTIQNMKVELANITVRIAFKCAKRNFSDTILGDKGAEKLRGKGDLLLNSQRFDGLQRIQGVNITRKELNLIVRHIKAKPCVDGNKFTIITPNSDLVWPAGTLGSQLSCRVVKKGLSKEDQLLADAIMWTFGREEISINKLAGYAHIHWNKASEVVRRMEKLGIVETHEKRASRRVIPDRFEDLPKELIKFLADAGYDEDRIIDVLPTTMSPKEIEDEFDSIEDQAVPSSNIPSDAETGRTSTEGTVDDMPAIQEKVETKSGNVLPQSAQGHKVKINPKWVKQHSDRYKFKRGATS